MATLLDKAISKKKNISEEEIELAIAWLKGDITNMQAVAAYGKDSDGMSPTVYRLANCLRGAYAQNRLAVVPKKK